MYTLMCVYSYINSCILCLTRQSFFNIELGLILTKQEWGLAMPNRERELNQNNPPVGYEMSLDEAREALSNLYIAIEFAEQGYRADIVPVGDRKVVIKGCCRGDNPEAFYTVCPDCEPPKLKIV